MPLSKTTVQQLAPPSAGRYSFSRDDAGVPTAIIQLMDSTGAAIPGVVVAVVDTLSGPQLNALRSILDTLYTTAATQAGFA